MKGGKDKGRQRGGKEEEKRRKRGGKGGREGGWNRRKGGGRKAFRKNELQHGSATMGTKDKRNAHRGEERRKEEGMRGREDAEGEKTSGLDFGVIGMVSFSQSVTHHFVLLFGGLKCFSCHNV